MDVPRSQNEILEHTDTDKKKRECVLFVWIVDAGTSVRQWFFTARNIIVAHRKWNHDHEESTEWKGHKNKPKNLQPSEWRKKNMEKKEENVDRCFCFKLVLFFLYFWVYARGLRRKNEIRCNAMAIRPLCSRRNLMKHQMKCWITFIRCETTKFTSSNKQHLKLLTCSTMFYGKIT